MLLLQYLSDQRCVCNCSLSFLACFLVAAPVSGPVSLEHATIVFLTISYLHLIGRYLILA